MKLRVLAIGAAAFAGASAASADHSWMGWYAGINAGYADASADTSRDVIVLGLYAPQDALDIEGASLIDLNAGGFTGGFQAGHNWTTDNIVFGIEGDFNFMNVEDSATVSRAWTTPYPGTLTTSASIEQNWLATIRGRLGTTLGSTLVYVTGGAAFADVSFTQGFSETTFPVPFSSLSQSDTLSGWTAGVGAEFPIGESTTLKLEYLHADLGSIDINGSVGVGSSSVGHADVTDDIFRIGFNVKL